MQCVGGSGIICAMSNDVLDPNVKPKPGSQPLRWSLPRKPPAEFKLPWANLYTEETAERICEEVAAGRSLQRILIEEAWSPSILYCYRWMRDHPDFASAYEMALRIRGEAIANEVVEIADNSTDHEHTRLQMQGRQWLSPKLNPRFREQTVVQQNTTAKVEVATVETIDVSHLTLEEIRAAEALLAKTLEGSAVAIEDMREDDGEDDE